MNNTLGHNGPEDQNLSELLFDITARFINIPAERIGLAIDDALREICQFCNIDRSSIWLWSADGQDLLEMVHIYQSEHDPIVMAEPPHKEVLTDSRWFLLHPEKPPVFMHINAQALFPWTTRQMLNNEIVAISRLAELPEEAAQDREMFGKFATKSTLILPLQVGGRNLGSISFASIRGEIQWSDVLVTKLTRISHTFVNALERKRYEQNLRISGECLLVASESAEADLWLLHLESGRFWVTDKVREKYGLERGENFTLEMFLAFVHPEDHGKIADAIRDAVRSRQLTSVEYRVTPADGAMKWAVSRARVMLDEAGQPATLSGITIDISERRLMEEQLREHNREIERLRRQLEQENVSLQSELKELQPGGIIGTSPAIRAVMTQAMQVAKTDSNVLILGETGTGKELLARAIHDNSPRKGRRMVTINCASLPPTLIEAELFGREKGAYTGALTRTVGRFELAHGSTIFLDEIGELPLELQAKLLRVIENGTFERLGSSASVSVDIRIIAATNRDLAAEVQAGRFRLDLYYRLNVFPITIPPLRERRDDILPLTWGLVRELQNSMGSRIERIPERTMKALTDYRWPGNVRELRNVIERAIILSPGPALEVSLPDTPDRQSPGQARTLEEVDRAHILAVLQATGWRMAGPEGAAALLGLERTTLYSKMKKLGIKNPRASK